MSTDDTVSRGFSLKRWSQRKIEAARATAATSAPQPPASEPAFVPAPIANAAPDKVAGAAAETPPLPAIESLTIDSDFSAFFGPEVDPGVKLAALKKLFRDPRFNLMDGLDVYIDDYSIPDPIAPELVRQLAHARYLFDPPRTRVNEAGFVEDVPDDEAETVRPDAMAENKTAAETQTRADNETRAGAEVPDLTEALPSPDVARDAHVDLTPGVPSPREGSEPRR